MACRHCMVNAHALGNHMSDETFAAALKFAEVDGCAMITGGEPTEHPSCCGLVESAKAEGLVVALLSNGMFLDDPILTERVLALDVPVQITNDDRYYPRRVKRVQHPRLSYTDRISSLMPLGRASGMIATRVAPNCFNLRSATRVFGSIAEAIHFLRSNGKFCTPTIEYDGTVRAGESNECFPIGTVGSTDRELTERLLAHDCDRCGLGRNLQLEHRLAIGLAAD